MLPMHCGVGGAILRLLKLPDQRIQPRREDDEIARIDRLIRVRHAGGDEDGLTCSDIDGSIDKSKSQCARQDVPSLIISVMHMQGRRPAAAPLVNNE